MTATDFLKIPLAVALMLAGQVALAKGLDLNDCRLLLADPVPNELAAWKARTLRAAEQDDQEALKLIAAQAINTQACLEESITGDAGWTVVRRTEGTEQTQRGGAAVKLSEHPQLHAAVIGAARWAHRAGQRDPGYRLASAQLVARYAEELAGYVEDAYLDAAGSYAFDCVLKRSFGKRQPHFVCGTARRTLARLTPAVPAERRAQLDALGMQWARELPAGSPPVRGAEDLLQRALDCKLTPAELAPLPASLASTRSEFQKPARRYAAPSVDVYALPTPQVVAGLEGQAVALMPARILLVVSGKTLNEVMAALGLTPDRYGPAWRDVAAGVRQIALELNHEGLSGGVLVGCEYASAAAARWVGGP